MQLDVHTAVFVSGSITTVVGLVTLFYSLARKENRLFIWTAMACGGFAASQFLAALRDVIPDFFSIVFANGLALFSLIAFFEVFCRLLSVRPKERVIALWLLPIQLALFVWYTYYQPDFEARVFVVSCSVGIVSACIIRLVLTNTSKAQRLFDILTILPFVLLFLFSMMRIVSLLSGQGLSAQSFTSPAYALSIIFYGISAVWVSLSTVFIVSNRLQTQVTEMALTDPLTGAFNRRALKDMAEREIARAKRTGAPLSLVIADLDHFKKVNDNFGHQAGDAVLMHTVALYKRVLRAEDVLARYGGEEFVAVLPGTEATNALAVAERLRKASKTNILVFANRPIPVTSSFGVAGYDNETTGYETLVKRADEALYRAKEGGRDRVVLFDQNQPAVAMRKPQKSTPSPVAKPEPK